MQTIQSIDQTQEPPAHPFNVIPFQRAIPEKVPPASPTCGASRRTCPRCSASLPSGPVRVPASLSASLVRGYLRMVAGVRKRLRRKNFIFFDHPVKSLEVSRLSARATEGPGALAWP